MCMCAAFYIYYIYNISFYIYSVCAAFYLYYIYNIPLYIVCAAFFSSLLLMDTWATSISWLL